MGLHLVYLLTLILLLNINAISPPSKAAAILDYATDKLALVKFKSHLTQYPDEAFSSWNDSLDLCLWRGVECGTRHRRVVGVRLKGMNLYGSISPWIGNLSFLQQLDLSVNSLSGAIPPELGRSTKLRNLNLSFNSLSGPIPSNLSRCTNLINISLNNNVLKHNIPWELGSLVKLQRLVLNNNNLTGNFPAFLGNLSSLEYMRVSFNDMEGEIPETVGKLKKLKSLLVAFNRFSGVFPPAIYNLSSLQLLALTKNDFHGHLRSDIGSLLSSIRLLWLAGNNFQGQIPASLSNASSSLSGLDLPFNRFSGDIPASLGNLQKLTVLNLHDNLFGKHGDDDLLFLNPLANCSSLQALDISNNRLGGKLTASVANLSSQLSWFNIENNSIGGCIPEEIARLVGLTNLRLGSNILTGNIPTSLPSLPRMQGLHLEENHLTGQIPSALGNLTQLLKLHLHSNSLEGSLPSTFSSLKHLQDARLCNNRLNGSIPPELFGLPSLTLTLNLSHNSFSGQLPATVGNLTSLTALDVSHNYLSGHIPNNLGLCLSLNKLNMEHNLFRGTVPDLSQLKGLQFLDLSKNNISGQIPEFLATFSSLIYLNLSCNNFQGDVPRKGVFENETATRVFGNSNLCGGMPQLNLQPCRVKKPGKSRRHADLKMILPPVLVFSCVLMPSLFVFFLCKKKSTRRKNNSISSFGRVYPKITYKELYDSTHGFSSDNLIGAGSFGTVYLGTLGQGELPVAIKVLNLHREGASRSFMAECMALGDIRHKNLTKILTLCSGIDYKGNDFKAFVYPYMSNGSLDKWLHPEDRMNPDRRLRLLQGINIAIDIASALQYLHHQCHIPIIHCDLKPSNVLLDDDLIAHISDFGLARLLSKFRGESNLDQFSSLGIKGTFGYIPPEYGTGSPVSTQGDVYSYGILLLELFTGRKPVDETFQDSFNIHNFVKMGLTEEVVLEVMHQSGLLEREDVDKETMVDCCVSVLQIGIECSAENPQERISMAQVVQKLLSVKEKNRRQVEDRRF